MKTEYKFIYFANGVIDSEGETKSSSTPCYECRNSKTDDILGYVFYYKKWIQHVFTQADSNIVFSQDCLSDIIHFMSQLKEKP